jgi:hypothetical protein
VRGTDFFALAGSVYAAYGSLVPTVLRENGYRIGFYSSEPDEPPHVHVNKTGREAKFWLGPVQLSWNKGFREAELRQIIRILESHETELIEAWNETE